MTKFTPLFSLLLDGIAGKIYQPTATKEVIVSAGTVMSPKVLMLSGIGPKKHLDVHGVGGNINSM